MASSMSSASSGTNFVNPPNLCWRIGLAVNNEKLYFSISMETEVTNIIVRFEEHNLSLSIPFRMLQLFLYELMSQREDNVLDHFGSCFAVNGCLIFEIFFASSNQILRCLEAITFGNFVSIFQEALANFASPLYTCEITATLVIFSNLNNKLHFITPKNAEMSFKLLYPDRPALPILHINDPNAYAIIKKSYDEIMNAFPNFFGEGGKVVDFSVNPAPDTKTKDTFSENVKSHSDIPSEKPVSDPDADISDDEILALSNNISCGSARSLGIALGLSLVDIENKVHPGYFEYSENIIQNILFEAKRQNKISRQNIVNALSKIKHTSLAKQIDPSFSPAQTKDISDSIPNDATTSLPADNLKLQVDPITGSLKFFDIQLAREFLDSKAVSFWVSFHKEIAEIIASSLKPYDASLGPSLVSSFMTKVKFKRISGVFELAKDIESNKYTALVSKELTEIGFKGKLGIEFKLNGKKVSPLNCESLCSEALLVKNKQQSLMARQMVPSTGVSMRSSLSSTSLGQAFIPKVGKQFQESQPAVKGVVSFTDKNELFFYIRKKDSRAIKLIKECEHLAEPDHNGYLPIHHAVQYGNVEALLAILHKGINIDIHTSNQLTPLHVAANCGQEAILPVLFEHNADKEAVNDTGLTPLRLASNSNHPGVVRILLENEAYVHAQCNLGVTSLHAASVKGFASVVEILLKHGANPIQKDNHGETPIKLAVQFKKYSVVKVMVASLPGILSTNECLDDSLLAISVLRNDQSTCSLLLENGSSSNAFYDGLSVLHIAVEKGFTDIIQVLIKHGADLSLCLPKRGTPLVYAIATDQYRSVLKLLELGDDPNLKDDINAIGGMSPLEYAVIRNKTNIASAIIHAGGNVNETVEWTAKHGKQPILHLMIRLKLVILVELAFSKNANIEATNTDKNTALHVAAGLNLNEIVQFLCQMGANVNAKGILDSSPLIVTIASKSLAASLTLLEFKADINICDRFGKTPLMAAIYYQMFDLVKRLIKGGASLTAVADNKLSVMTAACRWGNRETVELINTVHTPPLAEYIMSRFDKVDYEMSAILGALHNPEVLTYLLEIGVDPNAPLVSSNVIISLLHLACVATIESVTLLLEHGANPNVNSECGTPLYISAKSEHTPLETVELLLNANADPNLSVMSENGASPLYAAVHNGFYNKAKLLLDRNADPMLELSSIGSTVLHIAAYYNYAEMTELLLSYVKDPHSCKSFGNTTPLHVAASRGSNEVLTLLATTEQCDIDLQDEDGVTALLHAASAKKVDSAIALISLGAQVNIARRDDGITPLMVACSFGSYELAKVIIENGGNVDCQLRVDGRSALHVSVENKHISLVELLLQNKATVNLKTHKMETPLCISTEMKLTEITELLLKNGANPSELSEKNLQSDNVTDIPSQYKPIKDYEPLSMPKFMNKLLADIAANEETSNILMTNANNAVF